MQWAACPGEIRAWLTQPRCPESPSGPWSMETLLAGSGRL